jgi:hypothetical protein
MYSLFFNANLAAKGSSEKPALCAKVTGVTFNDRRHEGLRSQGNKLELPNSVERFRATCFNRRPLRYE